MRKTAIVLATLVTLGCAPAYADACSGRNHNTGTILGAVGGGLIGNAIGNGSAAGVIGGAVAGGLAGNAIARDIDCDRGRHYDRRHRDYYYYDRHGGRVYEERKVVYRDGRRVYEERYYRRD